MHSVHETVPSPLSVAKVAQEPPFVLILTLLASILPPKVACNPLAEPEEVEVISVPVILTFPLLVATIAFAPLAAVVIVPESLLNFLH